MPMSKGYGTKGTTKRRSGNASGVTGRQRARNSKRQKMATRRKKARGGR